MAAVALATGIGPTDLLAAPPEVFDAMVRRLEEQAKKDKAEQMKRKLRGK